MKKILKKSLLVSYLLILTIVPSVSQAIGNTYLKDDKINKNACILKMNEQRLWIDHVSWTRSFIISDIASLEDKDDVLNRLLKNQDDIGNSIKPYYGEEAGNKLASLLREHIQIAGQVVDAAKSNSSDLEKYNKLWHENADKIADFLSSANPNYSNKQLKEMLYKHLELVTDQVVARLNKDWKKDIESYDKNEEHMIMFADVIAQGIIKQFPKKFI